VAEPFEGDAERSVGNPPFNFIQYLGNEWAEPLGRLLAHTTPQITFAGSNLNRLLGFNGQDGLCLIGVLSTPVPGQVPCPSTVAALPSAPSALAGGRNGVSAFRVPMKGTHAPNIGGGASSGRAAAGSGACRVGGRRSMRVNRPAAAAPRLMARVSLDRRQRRASAPATL